MAKGRFGYYALMGDFGSSKVTSVLAAFSTGGPAQGVVWDVRAKAWRFDSGAVAYYLFDDQNFKMSYQVERPDAERLVRDVLHAELPSEDELRQICADGFAVWLKEEEELEDGDEDEDLENEVFDDEDDEPARPDRT